MFKDVEDIKDVITSDKKFCQLFDAVDSVAIVEWDGNYIDGCRAMSLLMNEGNVNRDKVLTVVLLGKRSPAIRRNKAELEELFPCAEVIIVGKDWKEAELSEYNIRHPFVIHVASTTLKEAKDLIRYNNQESRIINDSRTAYYAVISTTDGYSFFDNNFSCYVENTLDDMDAITECKTRKKTIFCEERFKSLNECEYSKKLSAHSAFSAVISELKNGCMECNQCLEYGKAKQCPEAQMVIARHFRDGGFVPKEASISYHWTKKAARQGYIPAVLQLAKYECEGFGCEKDVAHAVDYLNRYAKQGYAECRDLLIDIVKSYQDDEIFNPVVAVPYIRTMAEYDEDMLDLLVKAFENGTLGLPIDEEQKWQYEKLREIKIEENKTDEERYQEYLQKAENGDRRSMELVCSAYFSGKNLPKDYNESLRWGLKALEQGSDDVRFRVAWLLDGQVEGHNDYQKAFELYSALADEGNSAAMNNLGWMYSRGHFVDRDITKAFEWYLKAAEHGDEVASRNVAFNYRDGNGTEQDYAKSLEWFKKSADKGEVIAMRQIAEFYKGNYGTEQNPELVVEWLKKAIRLGDTDSMIQLGYVYETGDGGVSRDYEKALQYYRQAAEKGSTQGYYYLGTMYLLGKGIKADKDTAIYWYRKAAAKGYLTAKRRLKELGTNWVDENNNVTDKI